MAIYFQNTLVRTADFLKTSKRYSSSQSLSRAKKKGHIALKNVGSLVFAPGTAQQTAELYSVASWEGLRVIDAEKLPGGLTAINRIGKAIGVGEATIIEWGLFNRLDLYWVAGTFFANLLQAQSIAAASKK